MVIVRIFIKIVKKLFFILSFPFCEIQAGILSIFLLFRKSPQRDTNVKRILIIKMDAIGDYTLFRNFLEQTKKSARYKDYQIHLLGSPRYKDIAEGLDKEFVDQFVWADFAKISNNSLILNNHTFDLIKKITGQYYDEVWCPMYTRQYLVDRLIVKNIKSPVKIGFAGDTTNSFKLINNYTNKFYSDLISIPSGCVFEFYRNKTFFEKALKGKINLSKPFIDAKSFVRPHFAEKEYIVLFPGAGVKDKQWSPQNFATIIDYINEHYDQRYEFVIMGAKSDIPLGQEILNHTSAKNVQNLAGKTNLIELAEALSFARLLICNDTGAAHIAAALDTDVIFLLLGNGEYGRFGPYPPELNEKIIAIFPPQIPDTNENYSKLCGKRFFTTHIDDIKAGTVEERVSIILRGGK